MRGCSQWGSVFGVWEIEGAEFGVGIIGVWEQGVCAGGEEEALGASWSEGFRGVCAHGRWVSCQLLVDYLKCQGFLDGWFVAHFRGFLGDKLVCCSWVGGFLFRSVADFDFHCAAIVENRFNGCAVRSFDKLAVCVASLVDKAACKE